jgi:uncharacterized protein (DUF983 family)
MNENEKDETPPILDPSGKPIRVAAEARCPQCGAGPDRRVLTSGFGPPKTACGVCGRAVEDPS